MALFNKLFSSKRKQPKGGGYVNLNKSNESNWTPFNFSKEQVRILLFRECDWRGRKLLFDSNAVQKVPFETPNTNKFRIGTKIKNENNKSATFVEVTNGFGYQYIKPESDISMLGEMIFGAVAMTYRGNSLKVHSISSPNRIMCTKVFPSPISRNSRRKISNKSLEDSMGSSINSMSDCGSDTKFANVSGPLDVPSSKSQATTTTSLDVDSGIHGDSSFSNSCSSTCYCFTPRSSESRSNSFSSSSAGSMASLQRRWNRSLTTSLDFTFCPSGIWPEETHKKSIKRTKLGLALIITFEEIQEKEMLVFFFEHMAMVESMVERLRTSVEQAYIHNETFVHFMMEGTDNLKQWLWDLFCAPRLTTPIWLGLTSCKTLNNNNLSLTFLQDFCQLLALIDTKATNFFISTLVTAVLTHHLGWVNTILEIQSTHNNETSGKMFYDLSKSHPYNPLWAQMGDLYGALGTPTKIAKTIVTASGTKKTDLLNKILNSLTYFIRCGIIEKKVINCEQNLDPPPPVEKIGSVDVVDNILKFKEFENKEEILSKLEKEHSLASGATSSALTDEEKRYNIKLQILEREMNNLKSRKTFHCPEIIGNLGSPSGAEWENENDYPLPTTPVKSDSQTTLKQSISETSANPSCSYSLKRSDSTFHLETTGLKSSKTCFNFSLLNTANSENVCTFNKEQREPKRLCANTKILVPNHEGFILKKGDHSKSKKVIFVLGEDEQLVGLKNKRTELTVHSSVIELEKPLPCKIVGRSQSFNLPLKQQPITDNYRRYSDSDRKLDSLRSSSKLSLQTNFKTNQTKEEDKLNSGHAMFEECYSSLSDDDNLEMKKEEKSSKINKNILSFEDLEIKELPLSRLLLQKIDSCFSGYPHTLFGGVCDHYISDLVLHGCNDLEPGWESSLRRDLILSTQHSILDQQISEAVCIVANTESWEVQLVSSQTYLVDRPNSLGIRVGMSQLVANMLESLLHLWKLKVTPEHCLMHLESKLRELCLRSEALAEMLLSTDFCNMDLLTTSLDLEANDVPLLLAVASIHTPQLAQKYGLTFR